MTRNYIYVYSLKILSFHVSFSWNSNFRATQNATIHNKVSQQAYKEIGILEINCGIRSLLSDDQVALRLPSSPSGT